MAEHSIRWEKQCAKARNFMLVTRESALMTQTIYMRRCDPGWAGRPGSLGVAGRGSLISPGVAGRGARVGDPPRPCQPWPRPRQLSAMPAGAAPVLLRSLNSTAGSRCRFRAGPDRGPTEDPNVGLRPMCGDAGRSWAFAARAR